MDPNNNTTPGVGGSDGQTPAPAPNQDAATTAPETAQNNPASNVADAAMAGATPVVTTTDDSTTPAPATDAPAAEPISLAPSEGFTATETSTVSANPSGTDGAPVEDAPMADPIDQANAQPQGDAAQSQDTANAEAKVQPEENQEPLVAAAPVPGSIGSAKSYADIRRAEEEKTAKMNASKAGKASKNKIMIIIIAVIAVALLGIGGFILFSSGSSKPAQQSGQGGSDTPSYNPVTSTLSCKRNLATEEYTWVGAISGKQENIFEFADDELDGLKTNFSYTYTNKSLAEIAKNSLANQYGVKDESSDKTDDSESDENTTEESSETAEPSTTGTEPAQTTETTTGGKKTAAQMLYHDVQLEGTTVTHGMAVKSEDIKDWLESDAYSDVTYGAQKEEDGTTPTNVTRNLEFYKELQNGIGYTCSVSKGQ